MPAKTRADGAARERKRWDVWSLRPLADWITLGEAAADLDISREAVHRLVQRGTLKARRVGRRPVVLVSEKAVRALPMSPQRRRELERDQPAELGDELPGG
jgi:excisionase family DNA binding protein